MAKKILSLLLIAFLSKLGSCSEILLAEEDEDPNYQFVRRARRQAEVVDTVSEMAIATKLNSSHLHLMVHWAGAGSPVMFVLARSQTMDSRATSKTYTSTDYGKSFVEISDRLKLENGTNGVVAKFYHHPQSNCHYVFTDVVNRYLFTTSNCGQSFAYHKLESINPSLIVFDKNRDNTFLIHDLESPEKRLYVTKNFGQTFDVVQDYVRNFFFQYGPSETKLYVERIHLLANETTDIRVTILSSANFFEKHIDTEVVYRSAVQFQLMGDFLFVTRYRDETTKDHLDLFISQHGERFVIAKFPFSEDKNITHLDYHIIDVSDDGQIMIVVNHGPVLSNLYTSTKITPYEVEFTLSLENVMFYNPNVTWHDSWLSATAGDKPFADVYKIQGLRGIYVASQIVNPGQSLRTIQPEDLRSLITFDQGSIWTPVKGPKQDEQGNEFAECKELEGYRCNLHLSQQLSQKFPSTRSIPILSSKSAIGIVVASGNMGKSLMQKNNVFVSADAGLSWHQVLRGSYYFNVGDHGGILVATKYYKTQGPSNELLYSTNEGLEWKTIKFYKEPIKVYGLLTEPGENSTTFTIFGTETVSGVDWIVITIDLRSVFAKDCTSDDYKRWSPNDSSKGKHRNCLLGRKEIYERRMVHANCFNGRDYERLIGVENCQCEKSDYQCDFGFMHDNNWSDGCIQDPRFHHDPYTVPAFCRSGSYFNMTRGYIKIRGDSCEGGNAKLFEPHVVACPIREEKEFLLLSKRSAIIRVNLRNFSDHEVLPVENVTNVISLEYDLVDGCIFYGDTTARKIFKQCLNGSKAEVLVSNTETVEGMSYDWISKTLYFVDGSKQTIEAVRVDVKTNGRMRKTILDGKSLVKPRGIAVHPLHGQLFYSDWNEKNPHIGSANMDGSNIKILQKSPVVQWPNGLALDYVANRLYWTDAKKDAISSCRFDGSDYKIVMEKSLQLAHPFGVAIHKNLMFWDDWTHHGLFMADKNTGKGSSEILGSVTGAMDVKAFSFLHRQGQNGCSDNPCSHICIPLPDDRFKCDCPDGLTSAANSNGKTECKCPDGSDEFKNGTCPERGGTCSPEQFTCASGLCIPTGWVCNGNNDCGDNSDETDSKCNPIVCRINEFMCADREKCIPEKWKCDYDNDCRDGSDEKDCTTASCAPDQFRCNNGQCINQKWLCDLENDCQDGSDEDNCRERAVTTQGCKPSEFKCNNNSQQCLPNSWKCDGDFDCPGQEDEQSCDGNTCHDWQFDCGKGHCVFATWRCDGDKDCPTGSDEENCTTTVSPEDAFVNPFPVLNVTQCSEWTFRCKNGQCIPYWWKCDGSKDCSDNSDELECGNSGSTSNKNDNDYDNEEDDPSWLPKCAEDKFLCPKTGDCIWEAWLCDGENDCPGGEDEATEVCSTRPTCTKDMFRCEKSGQCIPYEHICNKIVDCPDGSDELACQDESHVIPTTNCRANEFPCDETLCIPDSKMCDGINDCTDATDELGCAPNHPQVLGLAVVGDAINATSVKVDWYVPDIAHAKDYDFQPSFAPEGTNDWKFLEWQKRPDMTYTFTNLRPFTTYKFRVNLRTESNIVYNTTSYVKTTTSPAMPSKPSIYEANHTDSSIVLTWTKPSSTNGPLKNYILEMTTNGSKTVWETDGPVLAYTLDAQTFYPGQTLTFRVRAVNSLFSGEWSNSIDVIIGHSIIEDRIQDIKVSEFGDTWVTFKWSKIEPQPTSILYNDLDWSYRVSYTILNNHFASYEDVIIDSSKTEQKITGLSPGSPYTFRFNVQKNSMAGPGVLQHLTTTGKALPKPTISEAKVTPSSGTSVKLSWTLPLDAKETDFTYGIFYGVSLLEMVGQGQRKTSKETTVTLSGLHACESYSFVVAIVGPKGFGPPSNPLNENTKFAAGAPPKNLQARLDKNSNNITISWKASCSVIDDPIGYTISVKDLMTKKTSFIQIAKTVDTSLFHYFGDAKYGTEYDISVQTSVQNALASNVAKVKTLPIPVPEGLTTFLDVNASRHDIMWNAPQHAMPVYLQNQVKENKVTYWLTLSEDPHMNNPELSINLTTTKYQLPEENLEPGKLYYVSVKLLDKDGYMSDMAGPVPLELFVPAKDLVVSPSSVAGVLVPIFIVICVMGAALAFYVHRNRKLSRNFAAFASRYSPATGASILNAGSLDDDDDDSPIIRGFADDEPLVVS